MIFNEKQTNSLITIIYNKKQVENVLAKSINKTRALYCRKKFLR